MFGSSLLSQILKANPRADSKNSIRHVSCRATHRPYRLPVAARGSRPGVVEAGAPVNDLADESPCRAPYADVFYASSVLDSIREDLSGGDAHVEGLGFGDVFGNRLVRESLAGTPSGRGRIRSIEGRTAVLAGA
jgi:hypothetical protein